MPASYITTISTQEAVVFPVNGCRQKLIIINNQSIKSINQSNQSKSNQIKIKIKSNINYDYIDKQLDFKNTVY